MSQTISTLANQLCQQVAIQERQFTQLQKLYDNAQNEIAVLRQQLNSQSDLDSYNQQYEYVNNLSKQTLSDDQNKLGNAILRDVQSIKRIPFKLFRLMCCLLADSKSEHISSSNQSRGQRPINDGRMLEIYIGLLMKAMNSRIVECGGSRGDQGVDIRATLLSNAVQPCDVIIQCKQYSGTLIQADRARELLGSMLLSETKLGILVSSDRISEGCRQVQSVINNGMNQFSQMRILLWDSWHLTRLFGLFSEGILDERDRLISIIKKEYPKIVRELQMENKELCINHFLGGECIDSCQTKEVEVSVIAKSIGMINISNVEIKDDDDNSSIESLSDDDDNSIESFSDDDDILIDGLFDTKLLSKTGQSKENISNFQTPKPLKLKSSSLLPSTPISKSIRTLWTTQEEIALSEGVGRKLRMIHSLVRYF